MENEQVLQYNELQLKQIGEQCVNRPLPISVTAKMFVYEAEREPDFQPLFHLPTMPMHKQNSNTNASAADQEIRMDAMQARLEMLENQAAGREVYERMSAQHARLETLETQAACRDVDERMNAQQEQLTVCSDRLDGIDTRLEAIVALLDALYTAQRDQAAAASTTPPPPAADDTNDTGGADLKEEVDVLFEDRDAMFTLINQASDRITGVERSVNTLTMRMTAYSISHPPTPAATPTPKTFVKASQSPRKLSIKTPDGEPLDFIMPKGKSTRSLRQTPKGEPVDFAAPKEGKPSASFGDKLSTGMIRSFSPGKQWAT